MFGLFKKEKIPVFPIGSVVYYTSNKSSIHPEKRERIELIVTDQDVHGWVSTKRSDNGFPFLDLKYSEIEL